MDTLSEYTIAPQHSADLSNPDIDPEVLEGVAYSPLKCTFLSSSYDESLLVVCNECDWQTQIGALPVGESRMYVQPDMCPDCAKDGELGFLRHQSPADGTLPSDWDVAETCPVCGDPVDTESAFDKFADERPVYADNYVYHLGCEDGIFEEVHAEVDTEEGRDVE